MYPAPETLKRNMIRNMPHNSQVPLFSHSEGLDRKQKLQDWGPMTNARKSHGPVFPDFCDHKCLGRMTGSHFSEGAR